jgi:hypothetical protein
MNVSIRAPVKRATAAQEDRRRYRERFNPRSREESDGACWSRAPAGLCFNPRSREESDATSYAAIDLPYLFQVSGVLAHILGGVGVGHYADHERASF